ncbi:diguanylate cyclase [bacterium 3DAC]|nr:diguanylate cyclase [bacterium 3DAC]
MEYDLTKPIEIAEDIYWIGYVVPNDPFQCHVYLIKNGKESILIDPGSRIVLPVILEKLVSLVPLSHIKYIIFHHQDPDITGSFEILEQLFPPNGERYVITHWRSATLLKHYNWKTPFWLVDEHDWKLNANGRELEFIFTPYAHFPGAFVTYDKKTGVLFSSDIFGSISDKFMLFAEDTEEYYEGVELFHKHYMPSNMILNYALDRIEERNPTLIAPQHGSIIPKHMIKPIIERLRKLDCGLYLLDDEFVDLFMLSKLDKVLQNIIKAAISAYKFHSLVEELYVSIKSAIPSVDKIVVMGYVDDGKQRYWVVDDTGISVYDDEFKIDEPKVFEAPLDINNEEVGKFMVFAKDATLQDERFFKVLFKHINYALSMSLQREIERESLEKEKELFEKLAETDPLTKLHNRAYLMEYAEKLLSTVTNEPISVLFIDIDHFKQINDTYGHIIGDKVLKEIADILKAMFREDDIVARYGGEEFVVVMKDATLRDACKKAEYLRKIVEKMRIDVAEGVSLGITVSIGVTEYRGREDFATLLHRADENMYEAKRGGRNRVVCK